LEYHIGIDLGGTNIKAGVVDGAWNIVRQASIPTETDRGQEHVLARMAMIARQVVADAGLKPGQIKGVGVGVPGPVDASGEVVLEAPNLGWKLCPVRERLEELTPWKCLVVNDANAAAYGEFIAGAGRDPGVRDMILITLGTGVGSGIVIKGELFIGPHGAGAELGHSVMTINGRPCSCGQRGCLEQYTSASAIGREAKKKIDSGVKTLLRAGATSKDVFDAAAKGDAAAQEIVDEVCEYMGLACVNFVHAFDPEVILLGGGAAAAGEPLVRGVRAAFKRHMWHVAPTHVTITTAMLGNDAGFIGAAGMAGRK
jgi:glucokinase